jgi:hypothetical protein
MDRWIDRLVDRGASQQKKASPMSLQDDCKERGRGRPTENPAALGWAYLIFEILFQEKKRKNHLKLERAGGLPKEDAWYSNLLSRRRAARVSSL